VGWDTHGIILEVCTLPRGGGEVCPLLWHILVVEGEATQARGQDDAREKE
jgi:hypothetical protein